jgi:N-acyl-D-aspartate/D-glutamate deacylase
MPEHDFVIRGGTVVDGSGASGFIADIAIDGGRITEVGKVGGVGQHELDAEAHVVTPGFIDGHTHMDAQVFWDPLGSPSCWHGVTTAVMGNCGFTLAPARSSERDLVVRNLERSEDISAEAMAEGIDWTWETFPQFLDAVEGLPKAINYACYVGHSALRTWALGEAAFEKEASEDELVEMERRLDEALDAGAVGFTTSRSSGHRTPDGSPVASRMASWGEIERLVGRLGKRGIFELALEDDTRSPDATVRQAAFDRMGDLIVQSGVTATFGVPSITGDISRWLLDFIDTTADRGGQVFGQSHCREMWILLSFLTHLPFDQVEGWPELRALPLDAQRRILSDPASRQPLVDAAHSHRFVAGIGAEPRPPLYDAIKLFDSPFPPHRSVQEVANERGVDPVDLMIDLALDSDFKQLFGQAGANRDPEDVLRVLRHPRTVMTFSDSGAHVSQIIDGSLTTYLLSYWVRTRESFTLEQAVQMITSAPAGAWGFSDRGRIAKGYIADLNVIDPEEIGPGLPTVAHDLPAGAPRLMQTASGILATIVDGQVVFEQGKHTGALPGRLLRRRTSNSASK